MFIHLPGENKINERNWETLSPSWTHANKQSVLLPHPVQPRLPFLANPPVQLPALMYYYYYFSVASVGPLAATGRCSEWAREQNEKESAIGVSRGEWRFNEWKKTIPWGLFPGWIKFSLNLECVTKRRVATRNKKNRNCKKNVLEYYCEIENHSSKVFIEILNEVFGDFNEHFFWKLNPWSLTFVTRQHSSGYEKSKNKKMTTDQLCWQKVSNKKKRKISFFSAQRSLKICSKMGQKKSTLVLTISIVALVIQVIIGIFLPAKVSLKCTFFIFFCRPALVAEVKVFSSWG